MIRDTAAVINHSHDFLGQNVSEVKMSSCDIGETSSLSDLVQRAAVTIKVTFYGTHEGKKHCHVVMRSHFTSLQITCDTCVKLL